MADDCCAEARTARRSVRIVTAPIRAYQRWLSPGLGARCRFEPSCSHYAIHVIERYGILRGTVLAGWRILRCNPWGGSGVDLPEDQRLFPLIARTKRAHLS